MKEGGLARCVSSLMYDLNISYFSGLAKACTLIPYTVTVIYH